MINLSLTNPAPIPLTMLPSGTEFVVGDDICINFGTASVAWSVTIPKGYKTDLASIPPELSLLGFDKLGRHSYAAILHDWLYTEQLGYELANALFFHALQKLGVPNWRAALMAFAVQAGGKARYKASMKEKMARNALAAQMVKAAT